VSDCPFCTYPPARLVLATDLLFAVRDAHPVSEGHTLVIPRRHVATFFDATIEERAAIGEAIVVLKAQLDAELRPRPDGYNVGFNAGEAAGQTVMHLHVHVIPRYTGDVDDPRGGIRGAIPSKRICGDTPPAASKPATTDAVPPTREMDAPSPFVDLPRFVPGQEAHFLDALRRAMQVASEIDILAAFVQHSGITLLAGDLIDALERGAKARILTGDYLGITHPHALARLFTWTTRFENLQVKLFRTADAGSFHPKAYIFVRDEHGTAFVGSSNLSASALTTGVEWNLRSSAAEPGVFRSIRGRFLELFDSSRAETLTAALVADYQSRVRVPPAPEPAPPPPTPHRVQETVLADLARSRSEGHGKGLVVMATGLGKTFLSAFDFQRIGGRRALFIAHREEILDQAADAWARVFPDRSIGMLTGKRKESDSDLVFASVQTLSREQHLRGFPPNHFDYIVIDEFHHAAAASYRKLLAHFTPRFLLGLTATPHRTDGAALLDLCGGHEVARVSLVDGISRGMLVPFRYFGVRDDLEFQDIPWRSGRFDPDALTRMIATRERAAQALREYRSHAPASGRRALVFCCSRRHADFVAQYFSDHGHPAAAVHSGPSSAPRAASLERLRRGELEVICAVDVFNEGVDLPDVNMIVMLRPTESSVIFIQQLGRGLRRGTSVDKRELVVVDFIGNHRAFMVKPMALLALIGREEPPSVALRSIRSGLVLPAGCSVEIETELIDMLERIARTSADDRLIHAYTSFQETHGRRPSAAEIVAQGVNLRLAVKPHGTWFDFVASRDDLGADEAAVLERHRAWFRDLQTIAVQRSHMMIALDELDAMDALHTDVDVAVLAERCRAHLVADPVLRRELEELEAPGGDRAELTRRWRGAALDRFHAAKGFSRRWFRLDADRLVSDLRVTPDDRAIFDAMTGELVQMRLEEHRTNNRTAGRVIEFVTPIELEVGHFGGNPILRFDRKRRPDIPEGEVDVRVDDQTLTLRFTSNAVLGASDREGGPNLLPQLMRRWFGPAAGLAGTRHFVELVRSTTDASAPWQLRARRGAPAIVDVIPFGRVPFYDDLRAACGIAEVQPASHDRATAIAVRASRPIDPKRHFVVRASGSSMDGGPSPIRDGDLVLLEWITVTDPREIESKPVLLTGGRADELMAYLKIPVRKGGRWLLRSTNHDEPDRPIESDVTLRVVGRVLEVVEERTGPVLWGLYDRDAIAELFGHQNNPSWRVGHRDIDVDGQPHTVLMVNLHKGSDVPLEHRYADRFLSREELQWESQVTTTASGAKGQRITGQHKDRRTIHLFVRYKTKDEAGKGEPYTYCGTLQYLRHEGELPMRVWFRLDEPLPEGLFRVWGGG
jgi:superfamily II DNA or RNA helicase/HKD family nuclease/diadenosine tetraphosphate (Ap4A) HIT family hydrolase